METSDDTSPKDKTVGKITKPTMVLDKPTSTQQKWKELVFLLNNTVTSISKLDDKSITNVDVQEGLDVLAPLIVICKSIQNR